MTSGGFLRGWTMRRLVSGNWVDGQFLKHTPEFGRYAWMPASGGMPKKLNHPIGNAIVGGAAFDIRAPVW